MYAASHAVAKDAASRYRLPALPNPETTFSPQNLTRRAIHPQLKHAFVVDDLLTPSECAAVIATAEASGDFSSWAVSQGESAEREKFRSCETIEVPHSKEFADFLWTRLRLILTPEELAVDLCEQDEIRWQRDLTGRWEARGTNSFVMVSKYPPGGHFAAHTDGFVVESFDDRSLFSLVLYLNDCEEGAGGETTFFDALDGSRDERRLLRDPVSGKTLGDPKYRIASIRPKAGRCCVFFHNLLHQSEPMTKGLKYIVRSDLVYERVPRFLTSDKDKEAFEKYQRAEILGDSNVEEASRLFQEAFKSSRKLREVYGM